MGILEKIEKALSGKKTYLVAILAGIAVAAQQLGYVIPDIVWPILGALGLGSVRSAIGKIEKKDG